MSNQPKGTVENTIILVVSSMGMACLISGLFCAFFNPVGLFFEVESVTLVMIARLSLLLGLATISIFSAITHGYIFAIKSLTVLKVISLVFVVLPVAAAALLPILSDMHLVYIISSFLAGCGYAFYLALWADALRTFWHYQVGIYVALGFLAAAVIALFNDHMHPVFALVSYVMLVGFSAMLLKMCRRYMGLRDRLDPVKGERFPLSPWHEMLLGLYSIACGVFIALFCMGLQSYDLQIWAVTAIMIAAAAYSAALMVRKRYLPSGMTQRVIALPLLGALFATPFVTEQLQLVIGFLVIIVFFSMDISNYSSLVALSDEQHVSPFFVISRGRLFIYCGLLIGVLVGYILFQIGMVVPGNMALLAVCFALACAILAMMLARPSVLQHVSDRVNLEDVGEKESDWVRHRCLMLAERYKLTAREVDVLLLLARGRNAKFIEKELFISLNTAKTHISHVYRKLGVSSQQALLDMVDEDTTA